MEQFKVELKLENLFAIEKEELFKVGKIIYIQEYKYQRLNNNQMDWYSTLTKNTKIKFDLDFIRQYVTYERLEETQQNLGIKYFSDSIKEKFLRCNYIAQNEGKLNQRKFKSSQYQFCYFKEQNKQQ
ncbi:unnamed protein product [Paramecium sonneborni]|uniref:Uncharacterized protein n=1 Tax=Paramecium sonneborni TaxID=65129 RepID=A0A8S1KEY0_9CILI|nr:unnamed protein product [Paramecium sonneborni]